ncbi:hypothetical protein Tco_0040573 [Tanacetum coccineum]
MRQRRWLELLSDYVCEIHYHLRKTNVVAGALTEARKEENYVTEDLCGMIKKLDSRADGTLCLRNRSNFTYVTDFMIVEDISSIIDIMLSQVVLGKPFVEISYMTHDPPEGIVRFTNGTNEVAYKMPHKIEQYNSLSDLEKDHMKLVYLRNKEDRKRGVEYVISKIIRFYKECLELGPEYMNGMDDEGEVT